MFINQISNSKKDIIDQCLLKYHYRYNRRFEGDNETGQDALNFGSYIHKIFEEAYHSNDINEYYDVAEKIKESYKIPKSYTNLTKSCIENFIKFNSKVEGETVDVEFKIDLNLGPDMRFIGYIDRVIKGPNGGLLIIDYKTSKREKKKVDLYKDSQLKGYCWAAHEIWGVPYNKITCALYYPRTNNLVPIVYNNSQIFDWKKKQIETIWRVRKLKKDEIKASQNQYCNWCEYKNMCPEFADMNQIKQRILLEQEKGKKKKKA
jgi:RecB family exonuclease